MTSKHNNSADRAIGRGTLRWESRKPNTETIILTHGAIDASIDHAEVRKSWNAFDLIATLIVLGLTLGVYLYFSFWI